MQKVDLKPNRDLLSPDFDGYKLSLDSQPTFSGSLPNCLELRCASEDQYSYHHAKIFGHTNVLVQDPFNPGKVFVLDTKSRQVLEVDHVTGSSVSLIPVWSFPAGLEDPRPGDYNVSLSFASPSMALISDGQGMIFIIDTGERKAEETSGTWTSLFHDEICGRNRPFVIQDARLVETTGEVDTVLNCLLHYVADKTKVEGLDPAEARNESSEFVNVVEWLTFASSATCWGVDRARRFVFFGSLDYLKFNPINVNVFHCSTDKAYKIVYDSQGLLNVDDLELTEGEGTTDAKKPDVSLAKRKPKFYYTQGPEDIVIWIVLPENTGKRDIKVAMKPRELTVTVKDEKVAGGELHHIVQGDSLIWTMKNGKLEIIMTKAAEGRIWQSLFADLDVQKTGEEISSPNQIDEIESEFASATADEADTLPTFNAEQLEACDAVPDQSFELLTYDGTKNAVSNRTDLQGSQWLFNLITQNGEPVFCLRHDVDGLVWQPKVDAGDIVVEHVGTFSAIGYVQASKQQRKFTVASPNFSYVAICDVNRHVYVYRYVTNLSVSFFWHT